MADDIVGQWERRPVILARSVRTARGTELVAPLRDGETVSVAAVERSDQSDSGPSQTTGTAGVTKPVVHDVSDVTNSDGKLALVGRPAAFAHVRIQRVAGIRSFWVGDSPTHRVFVVVDALSLKRAVASGRVLKADDIVAVDGIVERVPGTLGQVKVISWGRLDDKDAKGLSERDVYVYAKSVKLFEPARARRASTISSSQASR